MFILGAYEVLGKMKYGTYLSSPQWEAKKEEVRSIYISNNLKMCCVKCFSRNKLELHHNYYIDEYNFSNISDLDYLCHDCHKRWHLIKNKTLMSNNNAIYFYYKFFINENKEYWINSDIYSLLVKKISHDEKNINNYFSNEEVVRYDKANSRGVWMFLLGIPFIFFYFLGIILIIIGIIIMNSKKEPENYKIFKQKKDSLDVKKSIIKNAKKYYNNL
jgi:hypothetical protein